MSTAQRLRGLIDRERRAASVPGCAVVVVRDGEVVLCEGFGQRDLAGSLPVTPRTLFPIGSATKTFTAALLCRLAERDLVELDAPLRELMPGFSMQDPVAAVGLTLRDCLAHRSGLPRHDLVWLAADGTVTRDDLAAAVGHLPPGRPFRAGYDYNNLLYIVAGHLAAGGSYEQALLAELLRPVGLAHTTCSSAQAQQDPDHALPYGLAGRDLVVLPWVPLDLAGPAGSLNSCAEDLAGWLLAVTRGSLAGTWSQLRRPLVDRPVVGPDGPFASPSYGMGLMLETYRGSRIAFHGGNIDGFSSQVLTRDDGVGVAVLSNLHATSFRDALPYQVLDLLDGAGGPTPPHRAFFARRTEQTLAPLQARAAARGAPWADLTACAGRFTHPGYGPVEVSLQSGELLWTYRALHGRMWVAADLTAQVTFPFFGATRTVTGCYDREPSAGLTGLRLQLEPTLPPIEFTRDQLTQVAAPSTERETHLC